MDMQTLKPWLKPRPKVERKMPRPSERISTKHLEIIKREYATARLADITEATGLSRHRLHRIAKDLGIKRAPVFGVKGNRVRSLERREYLDNVIIARYAHTDSAELAAELGESVKYINRRANYLGINKDRSCPLAEVSAEVRAAIEARFPRGNIAELCRCINLPRDRVYRIAQMLGLDRELDHRGHPLEFDDPESGLRTRLAVIERKGYTVRRHAAL